MVCESGYEFKLGMGTLLAWVSFASTALAMLPITCWIMCIYKAEEHEVLVDLGFEPDTEPVTMQLGVVPTAVNLAGGDHMDGDLEAPGDADKLIRGSKLKREI